MSRSKEGAKTEKYIEPTENRLERLKKLRILQRDFESHIQSLGVTTLMKAKRAANSWEEFEKLVSFSERLNELQVHNTGGLAKNKPFEGRMKRYRKMTWDEIQTNFEENPLQN